MSEPLLYLSSSPHVRGEGEFDKIIINVIISLLPACVMGVYFYGLKAAMVLLLATVTAMVSEMACQKIMGREVRLMAGWAAITGLLLGMTLPPTSPWWMVMAGSVVAIVLGKQIYGGLGQNLFNPALVGRVVLLISWPVQMTDWVSPTPLCQSGVDAVTAASPLGLLKVEGVAKAAQIPLLDSFLGNAAGSLGEVSAAALLLGGVFLLWRGYISWHIPVSYIGTVALLTTVFWAVNPGQYAGPLFHLLNGGLMLGAFFMATDYVTSPVTHRGMLIFGAGCGLLTTIIRIFGVYPEGVAFSILFMNALTPLIDRYTKPIPFGARKQKA